MVERMEEETQCQPWVYTYRLTKQKEYSIISYSHAFLGFYQIDISKVKWFNFVD